MQRDYASIRPGSLLLKKLPFTKLLLAFLPLKLKNPGDELISMVETDFDEMERRWPTSSGER